MKKNYVFRSLSRFENEAGMFELEPVGMSPEFNVPISVFNRDDEQFLQMAEEIGEAYQEATGFCIAVLQVTNMAAVTRHGQRYIEEYQFDDGVRINDIHDVRDKIAFPKGIRVFDCELFVLAPVGDEYIAEEYRWIVAVPHST